MNEPFLSAIPILEALESNGFEAYFVGGSVRDYLLDRKIDDVDIATSATPQEVKKIFSQTVDIGIEHGTILVLFDGIGYEVTTFRAESDYRDYRRPETVHFIRSLTKDLERRDFTMNALAMDKKGRIIDLFNGIQAINDQLIETVGDAKERFHEDALRMMRAVRFVSQLEFSLHMSTKLAISENAYLLKHIAIERILAEFTKLIRGSNKKQALTLLFDCQIIDYLPGFKNHTDKLKQCLELDVNELSENQTWLLILALIDVNEPMNFLREWRMPSKQMKYIVKALSVLKERYQSSWTVASLFYATKEIAIDAEVVYKTMNKQSIYMIKETIENEFSIMPIKTREEIVISGEDLINWFNRPGGPWIKDLLQQIELAILNKEIANDRDEIKGWSRTCNLPFANDC